MWAKDFDVVENDIAELHKENAKNEAVHEENDERQSDSYLMWRGPNEAQVEITPAEMTSTDSHRANDLWYLLSNMNDFVTKW